MSEIDMWSTLVGFLMPALVAVINKYTWPSWLKGIVAVVSCIIAGGVTAWLSGDINGMPLVKSILIVLVATLGSYHVWWKPTGIAPAIEKSTSTEQ